MKGKTAIVTGASSGIGEATAERLAKAGYKVYGTSRRGARAGKRSFEMLTLDVTSDESVEAAVSEVMRVDGRIDLLVNNAGFSTAPAGAEELNRAGAGDLRHELLRARPHDPRRRAPHAAPGEWSHHQHRLRLWFPAGAVHGALCCNQARGRRVFGIARPRASHAGHPGLGHRACEHEHQFDANLLEPDSKVDEYREARAAVGKRLTEMIKDADEPGVVADAVLKAAIAAHPKLRYPAAGARAACNCFADSHPLASWTWAFERTCDSTR